MPPFCANVQPEISAPVNTANRIFLNLPITILPPPCVLYSTLEGEAERRAANGFSKMNARTLDRPPWLPDLEFSGLGLLVSRCLRPASVTHQMPTWAASFAPYRAPLADIGPIWAAIALSSHWHFQHYCCYQRPSPKSYVRRLRISKGPTNSALADCQRCHRPETPRAMGLRQC